MFVTTKKTKDMKTEKTSKRKEELVVKALTETAKIIYKKWRLEENKEKEKEYRLAYDIIMREIEERSRLWK